MNRKERIIQSLELEIESHKEDLAMYEALNRLAKNRDFKKVIDKGLFETKASQLVTLRGDIAQQGAEDQEYILKQIDSIGFLRAHFKNITAAGNFAQSKIEEAKAAIQEVEESDFDDEE